MYSFNPATYTTGDDFIGYSTLDNTIYPKSCDSPLTWTTNNNYGGCGSTAGPSSVIPTGCYNDEIIEYPGHNSICDTTRTCGSREVFNKVGDISASWTEYNCFFNWYGETFYRTLNTTTTATPSSTLPPNTDAGTITGTYTPTSTGSLSSATPTDSPLSSDSGGSSLSAGAIAGIVVGSLAGILILISLLLRRKILACFGYRKADQSVYSPVYPLQTPMTQFSPEVGNISQSQSPPPWVKPELAGHGQPTGPVRATPHEME